MQTAKASRKQSSLSGKDEPPILGGHTGMAQSTSSFKCAQSVAERGYPMSEVRGGGQEPIYIDNTNVSDDWSRLGTAAAQHAVRDVLDLTSARSPPVTPPCTGLLFVSQTMTEAWALSGPLHLAPLTLPQTSCG